MTCLRWTERSKDTKEKVRVQPDMAVFFENSDWHGWNSTVFVMKGQLVIVYTCILYIEIWLLILRICLNLITGG